MTPKYVLQVRRTDMGKYFGTDGFRGSANETLTAMHAYRVGCFLGGMPSVNGGRRRIVVGKDTRRSSYLFEYALAAGAMATGADVFLLHVTTTASVSYVARTEGFDCGVMISASHNPYFDNGIKLLDSNGEKMEEETISRLERYLDSAETISPATGDRIGRTVDYVAGRNRYLGYLLSIPCCSFRGTRVGLDCANGSGWAIAKAVFDALGAKVFLLGAEPDGTNINAGCGSSCPGALVSAVRESRLDVGFAFDGDADRCICVDERGKVVDGDGILYLCARRMKARGELEGGGIVATVMSNHGLIRSLAQEGISCRCVRVGDKYVYEEMQRAGFLLGGEPSGHVIFRKYENTGDGILTALKVMETAIESKCPVSCLTEGLIRYPQVVRSVRVKDKDAVVRSGAVRAAAARAEMALGEEGRILLRASGTEPLVRILAEGADEAACSAGIEAVERAIFSAE